MNAIMMYMSGNSLQIFSIMMVFMLFKGPIQGLINTNTVFAKFETEGTRGKLLGVKAMYVLMQLVLLGLGIWKVNAMGLLPYVCPVFDRTASSGQVTNMETPIGQRGRIGWLGNRNDSRWSERTLLWADGLYPWRRVRQKEQDIQNKENSELLAASCYFGSPGEFTDLRAFVLLHFTGI